MAVCTTTRYDSIDSNGLEYDAAGNLTTDKDGYIYEYDYENRIVKITKAGQTKAEFAYDALGRRIRKIAGGQTTLYYNNPNWQVLCDYNDSDVLQHWFIYGNYIDEVLRMTDSDANDYYYVHDHLYSPAALIAADGNVVERYEYDAYGNCNVLDSDFSADSDGISDYNNPYLFTGRRVDILDNGSLKLMSWPYRNYSTYLGRWYQHEKLGMIPNDSVQINPFNILKQYTDGMNVYDYVNSNPVVNIDLMGLTLVPIGPGVPTPPIPVPRVIDLEWDLIWCTSMTCAVFDKAWVEESFYQYGHISLTVVDGVLKIVVGESLPGQMRYFTRRCICQKKGCCHPANEIGTKRKTLWIDVLSQIPTDTGDDLVAIWRNIRSLLERERWIERWSEEKCIADCKRTIPRLF